MKTIERVKDWQKNPGKYTASWPVRHVALLIEYYEAHQDLNAIRLLRAIFKKEKGAKGIKKLRQASLRLQQARIALEREE